MPLQTIATPSIEIEIPDFVSGETVIKRTATLFTMTYNQFTKRLVLTWVVKHFSKLANEAKGDYLGEFMPDWPKDSIADNTTMCDVATGHPIEKIDTGLLDDEQQPIFDYDQNINYMGQYDYFYNLAQAEVIQVHSMIREFGLLIPAENWVKK